MHVRPTIDIVQPVILMRQKGDYVADAQYVLQREKPRGYRAPRDIYFSNVNPSPLYGFAYNPKDLKCLNCKQPIDFEKSEALVCDKGHRHCSKCACQHIPSNHSVCPECMNGPTERLVVGISVSISLFL